MRGGGMSEFFLIKRKTIKEKRPKGFPVSAFLPVRPAFG
jgi:hypothetical protein